MSEETERILGTNIHATLGAMEHLIRVARLNIEDEEEGALRETLSMLREHATNLDELVHAW